LENRLNKKNIIIYCITLVLSILYIYIGRCVIFKDVTFFASAGDIRRERAVVTEIIYAEELSQEINGETMYLGKDIKFKAKMLSGDLKGEEVEVLQNLDNTTQGAMKEVNIGDKLLLQTYVNPEIEEELVWYADEFIRLDGIIILGIVFIAFVIIFGRVKGINTVISLIFTCLAVFLVFIPSILAGANIYLWAIITCIYITAMTMLIVYGANKKSIAATIGCISGTALAGILTVIMSDILKITGLMSEETMYLLYIEGVTIDLVAIIFGAITVGAIGAVMDVSMSISSSLNEICEVAQKPTFKMIMKSGINIGKDMMGTMTNTLILAYIGSSLSAVLLACTYSGSLSHLMNKEVIVVEILQGLVGSIGILFTIPFTTFICAMLYIKKGNKEDSREEKETKIEQKESIDIEAEKEIIKNENMKNTLFIKDEWKNKLDE